MLAILPFIIIGGYWNGGNSRCFRQHMFASDSNHAQTRLQLHTACGAYRRRVRSRRRR